MTSTETKEPSWLERMHTFLTWKISPPEISNPYKQPLSDKALNELATDKSVLVKFIEIRAMMDGEELVKISDLSALNVKTAHPHISKMRKAEIKEYLSNFGIFGLVEKEIPEIQKNIMEELNRRKSKAKV